MVHPGVWAEDHSNRDAVGMLSLYLWIPAQCYCPPLQDSLTITKSGLEKEETGRTGFGKEKEEDGGGKRGTLRAGRGRRAGGRRGGRGSRGP